MTATILAKRRPRAELLAYEAVLANGLRDFLSELVMVNGGVMLSYICNNQHAHLGDIIGSSMEHRIKPGRLHYSNRAEIEFDWGAAPSVALAMELRDERMTAFFDVVFGRGLRRHRPPRRPFHRRGPTPARTFAVSRRRRRRTAADRRQLRARLPSVVSGPKGRIGDGALQPVYMFELAAQHARWATVRQAVITGNIANANTAGYVPWTWSRSPPYSTGPPAPTMAGT